MPDGYLALPFKGRSRLTGARMLRYQDIMKSSYQDIKHTKITKIPPKRLSLLYHKYQDLSSIIFNAKKIKHLQETY